MKIDFNQVREERIEQIKKDIRKAVLNKDWSRKRMLDFEKKELEERLKK